MQFSKIGSLFLYLGIYIFSSLCLTGCANVRNKLMSKILYFVAMFVVVFLAAIRYKVGTDYITYTWIYEGAAKETFVEWFTNIDFTSTPLAVFLFAKIAYIFDSANVFFMLFAVSIYMPISLVILKHKDSAPVFLMSFAFLTTIYTTGFNIMKQIAACAFVLYSLQFVFDRKPIKFILSVFIAFCFHPTAIIALPLYFFGSKNTETKVSHWRAVVGVLCYVVVCVSYRRILAILGGRFEDYSDNMVQGNNYSFFLSLAWFFVVVLFSKSFIDNDSKNYLYIVLLLIGVLLESLGFISAFIKRISLYFSIVSILLIPQFTNILGKKFKVLVGVCSFVYYIALFVASYYVLGQANIIPFVVK